MKRSTFFKSLATFIAAPSIVKDIGITPTLVVEEAAMTSAEIVAMHNATGNLFYDVNVLIPQYFKEYNQKYKDLNVEAALKI